jgi:chromosome segregation ATPase
MTEKKPPDDPQEPEMTQIEHDINQLISEMSTLSGPPELPGIFRDLHSLLMDSHGKNQMLAGLVQKLNAEVVSNAMRVASVLQLGEDDGIALQRCRDEYKRSWQIASAWQAREMAALEQCETLRGEIARFTESVRMQPRYDSCIHELWFDIKSHPAGSERRIREMEMIRSDIARVQLADQDARASMDRIAATARELTNAHSEEDEMIAKLQQSSAAIQREIAEVLADNADSTKVVEQNEIEIPKRRSAAIESRTLILQLEEMQTDCKEEAVGFRRGIRSSSKARDELVSVSERMEGKMRNLTQELSQLEEEAIYVGLKVANYQDEFRKYKAELGEWQQRQTKVRRELELSQRQHRNLSQELTRKTHGTHLSEFEVHQIVRSNDPEEQELRETAAQFVEEKVLTHSSRKSEKLVSSARTTAKAEAQTQQSKVALLEEELRRYREHDHDAKIQLFRFTGTLEKINDDVKCAEDRLERLNRTLRNHDTIIHDMEGEHHGIENQLKVVREEYSRLEADFAAKREQVVKLKNDIRQRAQDCISLHFQTHGVANQMKCLKGAADMTQRLLDEVQATTSCFKVEERKLQVVYSETLKDVRRAKVEFSHVEDLSRMLQRQLSSRKQDVSRRAMEFTTLMHDLERHAAAFDQQSDELLALESELERAILQYRSLQPRGAVCRAMRWAIMNLENRINRELEVRGHCELQLFRPVHVHHWMLLKTMEPEHFRNIQMVQYLKSKLDRAFHQRRRLDAQKATLLSEFEAKKEQTRRVRIRDGDYAISVVCQSISNKEKEMKEIEGELNDCRLRISEMESAIDHLKVKIAHSYSEIAPTKRKKFDPTRPVGPPTIDRMGTGGRFDMPQRARKRNPRFAKHNHEPPEKPDQDEAEASWEPGPSVSSPTSARDADSVRRNPRLEAKWSKPKERESVALSARSSARLSTFRPRVRRRTANIQS